MSKLFEPSSIGRMALKNRIVRSAFLENMAAPEGLPTVDTLLCTNGWREAAALSSAERWN